MTETPRPPVLLTPERLEHLRTRRLHKPENPKGDLAMWDSEIAELVQHIDAALAERDDAQTALRATSHAITGDEISEAEETWPVVRDAVDLRARAEQAEADAHAARAERDALEVLMANVCCPGCGKTNHLTCRPARSRGGPMSLWWHVKLRLHTARGAWRLYRREIAMFTREEPQR